MVNLLRPAILGAANSHRMKSAITRAPISRKIVKRFIAGETRADVLAVVEGLLASGRAASRT